MDTSFTLKNSPNFCCTFCNYICSKKSDLQKHFKTLKHKNGEKEYNKDTKDTTPEKHFCDCGKKYSYHSGLWKHKQVCTYSARKSPNGEKHDNPSNKDIIDMMKLQMIENQEMRKMMLDQQQKIFELSSKTSISNSNNTICNNKFNLNFFLNEQCKDALNITDFVDSIKLQLSDLESTGQLGFAEGISKIFITSLKQLDTCKRPIHCSDLKREVIYIKDENQWTKENEEKQKIQKIIKEVANKNIKQIPEWVKENPDCSDFESKKNDMYMKIVGNCMSGSTTCEQEKNIDIIIKNVAKEVYIEK
jgi:hypothetical protein